MKQCPFSSPPFSFALLLPAAPMGKPLPGNAAKLAAWIQEAVGGDLAGWLD